ncbi:MAG: threonine ammonia-lyase [Pseudomonadota bacterium]
MPALTAETSYAPPTLADIQAAHEIVKQAAIRTPLVHAPKLSELTGADIFVKYENMQVTNSFKDRGASVKLSALAKAGGTHGVIAMSAGNHAQSVAYHARRVGLPATIIMPEGTPFVKVARTKSHGARVVLEGDTLIECRPAVDRIMADEGLTLVHPYDDPLVMAGQGTIGIELMEDMADLDALVIPIGGGGLISGITLAAKAVKPDIKIYGVETKLYPSMHAAVNGYPPAFGGDTLAEGIAVKTVANTAIDIVRKSIEDILLVSEDAIEAAVYAYLVEQKTLAEGAGAAPLAALLEYPNVFQGQRVGLILCGGNIDPRVLSSIAVRALEREDRIISLRVTIRDRPGVLGLIASLVGRHGGNIIEVSHHRLHLNVPATAATLDVTFEARDAAHGDAIVETIRDEGMPVMRLPAISGH